MGKSCRKVDAYNRCGNMPMSEIVFSAAQKSGLPWTTKTTTSFMDQIKEEQLLGRSNRTKKI